MKGSWQKNSSFAIYLENLLVSRMDVGLECTNDLECHYSYDAYLEMAINDLFTSTVVQLIFA